MIFISSPFPSHTQLSLLVHRKKKLLYSFLGSLGVCSSPRIYLTLKNTWETFSPPHFSIFGLSLCLRVCRCKAAMTPSFLVRNSIYILRCREEKSLAKRKKIQCYRISRRILNQKRTLWASEKSNKIFFWKQSFFWREDEGNRILAGKSKRRWTISNAWRGKIHKIYSVPRRLSWLIEKYLCLW